MEVLPMIVAGLAVFAIIMSILLLAVNHRMKVKPKSKKEAETLMILKYPMMVLFLSLIILTIVVITTRDKKIKIEDNMDSIIRDTSLIIENAKTQLSDVSVKPFVTQVNAISSTYDTMITDFFFKKSHFEELSNGAIAYDKVIDTLYEMSNEWSDVYKLLSSSSIKEKMLLCQKGDPIDIVKLEEKVLSFAIRINRLSEFTRLIEWSLRSLIIALKSQAREQFNAENGKNLTINHLGYIQTMMNHFKIDIDESEMAKDNWNQRVIDSLPLFSTQIIVTAIVTVACLMFWIISPVSIFSTSHQTLLGEQLFAKCVLISFNVNGILNIIIGIFVIILSSGLIGNVACRLEKETFGLWNLTTPFIFPNHTSLICATYNSTFLNYLENGTLLPSEKIIEKFKIDEYKGKMLKMVKSDIRVDIPSQFYKNLFFIGQTWENLEGFLNNTCFPVDHQSTLSNYNRNLRIFLDDALKIKELAEKVNSNFHQIRNSFSLQLDEFYQKQKMTIETCLSDMVKQIASTDFQCDPIISKFATIGSSICKQFDYPLEMYWMCLIITISICSLFQMIQCIVYRNLHSAVIHETVAQEYHNSSTLPVSTQAITV